MTSHAVESLGAHCTEAHRRPLSSMGSARPGVPLSCSAAPAEAVCALLESGQLARRGNISFEAKWPHHITSCDGRMAAIMRKSASELVGYTIDAVFSAAADKDAVCMGASCANRDAHSVFTFHGLADGLALAPDGLSDSRRPSLFIVGAARSFRHTHHHLELIALPLPSGEDLSPRGCDKHLWEQPRGEVTGFPSSAFSPCRLCDATLELRLCGGSGRQTDLALDASGSSDSEHDAEIIGYFVEGQALADKLDKLDL